VELTNSDVADILALLDSLPYDELELETASFRLTLRRTPDGWTQSAEILSGPAPGVPSGAGSEPPTGTMPHRDGDSRGDATSCRGPRRPAGVGGTAGVGAAPGTGLFAVTAPLPGTFYRAPAPGAAPFVEVGSRVSADSVVGIVETMKLMNAVPAGVAGTVAGICLGNAEFAEQGATLMRIEADQP
jgi:acetyl-CoA carboxylase biotin carboxyl carrier protein